MPMQQLTYYTDEGGVERILQGSSGLSARQHQRGHIVVEEAVGVEHDV